MSRVTLGAHSYGSIHVVGKLGSVQVGKFCSIAGDVKAIMVGHNVCHVSTYPFNSREFRAQWPEAASIPGHPVFYGDIRIHNDVWIGQGATLRGGLSIGSGAVLAAGSVVARDVPPYCIVAGNPASVIKIRYKADVISALLDIAWWDWEEDKIKEALPLLLSTNVDRFLATYGGKN